METNRQYFDKMIQANIILVVTHINRQVENMVPFVDHLVNYQKLYLKQEILSILLKNVNEFMYRCLTFSRISIA